MFILELFISLLSFRFIVSVILKPVLKVIIFIKLLENYKQPKYHKNNIIALLSIEDCAVHVRNMDSVQSIVHVLW